MTSMSTQWPISFGRQCYSACATRYHLGKAKQQLWDLELCPMKLGRGAFTVSRPCSLTSPETDLLIPNKRKASLQSAPGIT
eukprot:7684696-Pyramimonas_sp.AAC.1